jgi:acetyl esterase/lipase
MNAPVWPGLDMPLDPSAQRFLDLLAAGRAAGAGKPDLATQRESFRSLLQLAGAPGPATVASRDEAIAGPGGSLRLRLYTPAAASGAVGAGLLFFHGGGFVAGDLETHDGICRVLADASGCRVVALDYRLAPEHPFPAAVEDGLAALEALAADPNKWGIDRSRLALGGDSVGGGLAAALCQEWRKRGEAPLAAQLLICPVLDAAGDSPSRQSFAKGYYLEVDMIAADFAYYCLADQDRRDPRLSPLRQKDFSGLPPALIHAAEFDPFRDETIAYGELLRQAGIAATATCHEGMIHQFYAFSKLIPKGGAALTAIGRELGEFLSRL